MDIMKSKEIAQFSSCALAIGIPFSWVYQKVWKKREKRYWIEACGLVRNEFTCVCLKNHM